MNIVGGILAGLITVVMVSKNGIIEGTLKCQKKICSFNEEGNMARSSMT